MGTCCTASLLLMHLCICHSKQPGSPCLYGSYRTWIEARQQAAEEDLEMPVVLEEFGCKLDKRSGLSVPYLLDAFGTPASGQLHA